MKSFTSLSNLYCLNQLVSSLRSHGDIIYRLRVDYVSLSSRLRVLNVIGSRMIAVFLLLLTFGVSNAWGQASTATATDGGTYVVTVYDNSTYYALPNNTTGGQWAATEVEVNGNGKVTTENPPLWTFEEGSTSGQFYLYYKNGDNTYYLYKNGNNSTNQNIAGKTGNKNYWQFTKNGNKYNVLAIGRGTYHTRLNYYTSGDKWQVYQTSSTTYNIILLEPAPVITCATTSLTGFTYVQGSGPSSSQSFSVSGNYLGANITVSATDNYEVSTTSGSGYGGSVTLTKNASGVVSATTVYVRLKSGLSSGTRNGTITISSTGATDKTISLSGTVSAPVVACGTNPTAGSASLNGSFL